MQKDTLKEFGESFQNKCIALLTSDQKFLTNIYDIIDAEYFDNSLNKVLVTVIKKYYEKYNTPPTIEALTILAKKNQPDSKLANTLEHLKIINDCVGARDSEYVKEEFQMFCKNQNMKQAILSSVDLLQLGKYNEIQQLMNTALQAGEDPVIGHLYKQDLIKRMTTETRKTIATPWDEFNNLMGGGLGPGELGVFVGMAGSGKSWCLSAIGLHALKMGKNVAHYTLELNDIYTAHRYDTVLTSIPLQHIKDEEHRERVERMVNNLKGELIVTQYPTKFATPLTIHNHMKRLRSIGYNIDLIVLDYADLLSSGKTGNSNNDNSYEIGGSIYEQLRGISGDLGVPMWTVSQAGRSAASDNIIEADKIAESFKKVMTADFVASLSRKTDDKLNNKARFHIIKNRFGPDGMSYASTMDTEKGIIEIENSITGISNDSVDDIRKNILNNLNK